MTDILQEACTALDNLETRPKIPAASLESNDILLAQLLATKNELSGLLNDDTCTELDLSEAVHELIEKLHTKGFINIDELNISSTQERIAKLDELEEENPSLLFDERKPLHPKEVNAEKKKSEADRKEACVFLANKIISKCQIIRERAKKN